MRHRIASLTLVAVVVGCGGGGNKVTTLKPPATMHTTFFLTSATIDPDGNPCTPPTPPAPTIPAAPAASTLLVGYQDWRNTTSSGGDQCTSSIAKRWEGVATFDMSSVVTDINASPFKTLTGTLTYHINSNKVPQSPTGIDLCVAKLERVMTIPTANGLVPLNTLSGGSLPVSITPNLGPLDLPGFAPTGTVTSAGPASVNPAAPEPTVTVEATLMLSDWDGTKEPSLAIAFVPQGPTLAQMGVPSGTPVPANRSTAACVSNIKDIALTVNVGR
jgi:hypothetical protein